MTPLLALAVGLGLNRLLRYLLQRCRHSEWVAVLLTSYGAQPTGEGRRFTRRDHLRSAGLSLLAALGCGGAALVAFAVGERYPNGSQPNLIADAYFFCLFLLAAIAPSLRSWAPSGAPSSGGRLYSRSTSRRTSPRSRPDA